MQAHLSTDQLQHFKDKLIQLRDQVLDEKTFTKQMSTDLNLSSELSKIDNHLADQATEMYEQQREIAFYDAQERRLTRIEDALSRIEQQTYGICTVCQQPIDVERLEALPEAATCQEHAPQTHAFTASYEYLPIAMEQINMDDTEFNGFDGEDSIQQVLSYGNSSYDEAISMLDTEFAEELVAELDGFCEPMESFVATDITGQHVYIVRNNAYQRYLNSDEGDQELEHL